MWSFLAYVKQIIGGKLFFFYKSITGENLHKMISYFELFIQKILQRNNPQLKKTSNSSRLLLAYLANKSPSPL